MKSNIIKYYVSIMTSSVVAMLAGGAILQAFLIESGLSEESVNFLVSAMQIMQVTVMVGLSKKMDGVSKMIEASAFPRLCDAPLMIFLLALCFFTIKNTSVLFVVSLVLLLLYSIGIGITNITAYKLPYLVIDVNDYGRITAIGGIAGAILTVVISAGMSYFQQNYDYFLVMKWVFLAAIVFLAGHIASTLSLKELFSPTKNKNAKKVGNILKYKPFTSLIIPNMLRGFNAGIISIAATVGYYTKLLDASSAAVLVVISNVVTIVGCYIYSHTSGKIKDSVTLLISSIAIFLAMPMMIAGENTITFLIFYGVSFFFYNIVNYAVPAAVVKFVDYDVAGQYNAGRMILHTLGMSLAGFVCVALFRMIGPFATMIFAGVCQLISGIGYYVFLKKTNKEM